MGSYILKLSMYLICIYLFMFEIESYHVAPGGLGHAQSLLLLPPHCWDYRHGLLYCMVLYLI